MFWGEPTPLGEKRSKLHMPLAGDIARTSADLLFSEPPTFKVENSGTQQRLEDMLTRGFKKTLLGAGEVSAALGGVYLRAFWDDEISDRPWITAVHADAAAPEFRGGQLYAVTFWTVLESDGTTVVRHLERHEPGTILHGVYEGTVDNLGTPRKLADFAETRVLLPARSLNIGRRLAVEHVPNSVVARDWRDVPGTTGLGQADIQGSETFLDALDETYTSWMRDIRLGKSRIIVPDGYMRSNGPGQGMSWDDREVFAGLNIPPSEGRDITLNQFAIRYEEHQATVKELIGKIVRNAGYNGGTFGDDSAGPAITATEIKAKQARSLSTRARKAELFAVALADITETLLILEGTSGLFPGLSSVEVERPDVRFADSVQDDIKTLAETAALMRQAEAASTETLVALLNPSLDTEAQKAEVARILKQSGRDVSDPAMTGAEGGGHAGFPSAGGGSRSQGA
ncbi:phage portal protein [Streptomyces sp. NBC_01511]|uniref:phage portal protein n=1 Tax=Streptomyces sp. NBC_01511 TaxID=2903889 RepID=UPI00386A0DAB